MKASQATCKMSTFEDEASHATAWTSVIVGRGKLASAHRELSNLLAYRTARQQAILPDIAHVDDVQGELSICPRLK